MWLVYTCQYNKAPNVFTLGAFGCGQSQDRTGDPTLFRRVLYRLSYLAKDCRKDNLATLTGLEPATSAVTGRRANQLRHRALKPYIISVFLNTVLRTDEYSTQPH